MAAPATSDILTVEDALIAQCRDVLGTRVRAVESLPGDWDDEMLNRLLRATPGVFVAFAGGTRSGDAGATAAAIDARWLVYTCTSHASGEAARRRGDALQVGAYELIALLAPALHAFNVRGVGSFSLLEVSNLYTGTIDKKGLSVYALALSLPMSFDAAPLAEDRLGNFQTFDAQLDVPPLASDAQHRAWLHGDYTTGTPDAHDTVTLPAP